MNFISTPRLVISGVTADAGVSFAALGLAFELRKRGLGVSCCVLGSHLQTAVILRRICGRYVPCLDRRILSKEAVLTGLYLAGLGADILLIVGEDCLYDGISAASLVGSSAEISLLSAAPVVLVADASKVGNSLGALIKGYVDSGQGLDIAGTILNRVSGPGQGRDLSFFGECLLPLDLPPLLGGIRNFESGGFELPSGINQAHNSTAIPRTFLVELGNRVAESVKVDEILNLANDRASRISLSDFQYTPEGRITQIAVSEGPCFSLCFQENLELLKYFGANLVYFSPLADSKLPGGIGGVYLTGSFLSEYGQQVTGNIEFMRDLLKFAHSGGVIYSEGSGTAFLCEKCQLRTKTEVIQGVGVIPAMARTQPENLGYFSGQTTEDSVLGAQGLKFRGIYMSDWKMVSEESVFRTMRLTLPGSDPLYEGLSPTAQAFCTFGFINFLTNPLLGRNLVEACAVKETL